MKIGDICYFVKGDKHNGVHVSFGVYDGEKKYGGYIVSNLQAPEARLINGIPFDDFESETEWKKVPKGWTYNTEMFSLTYDENKMKSIRTVVGDRKLNNKDDIQWLFDSGYLVRVPMIKEVVEAEYDHNMYRLVKRCPHWTATYGTQNVNYPDYVFTSLEEAEEYKIKLQNKWNEQYTYADIMSAYENLDWALDKYEQDHGGKEIENIKQKFLQMPRFWEKIIRYYRGEILIADRYDKKYEWVVIA